MAPPKKLLLITYYWPPSGGSPVLRWLKFVKYLHEFGWDVTVYTAENPEPQAIDESLLGEIPDHITVIKKKIKEPYGVFKSLLRKPEGKSLTTAFISESSKKSQLYELSVWIRGNLFIPDARKFWIKPSIKFLTQYLLEHPHDAIVSTGPPHSLHLIAQSLKKKTGIPWLADFRDPWTNIDYYHQLKLTKSADRKHHKLEASVLQKADIVVTVGPTMTKEFTDLGASKVVTLTNGFDTPPFIGAPGISDTYFTILHVGSMPESRNPEVLWRVLGILVKENPGIQEKLKIELIGNVDHSIIQSLQENGLNDSLVKLDHMANQQVLKKMTESTVLLLVINNTQNATGILTNKFFEYLSVQRPIIAIGPTEGDAAEILKSTGAGQMIDYADAAGTENYLRSLIDDFNKKQLTVDVKNIDAYSRRNLTASLAKTLDLLIQ